MSISFLNVKKPSWSQARDVAKKINQKVGYQKRTASQIRSANYLVATNANGKILATSGLIVADGRYLEVDFYVFMEKYDLEKVWQVLLGNRLNEVQKEKLTIQEGSQSLGVQYMIY